MKTPEELMEEIDKRTWTTKVKILEAIRQRDAEWEERKSERCPCYNSCCKTVKECKAKKHRCCR